MATEAERSYQRAWYAANRKHVKIWRRANYVANIEKRREYGRNYARRARAAMDPDERRAGARAYYEQTRPRRLELARAAYPRFRESQKARRIKQRDLLRAWADAERVRGCVDCGEKDMRLLDFDHVRGTKTSDVARLIGHGATSVKTLLAEIDKCEVRCSNCHRRVTAERRAA